MSSDVLIGGDDAPMSVFGNVLFFQANDGVHGSELWRTDGTVAGTFMAADLNPGAGSSLPGNFFEAGSSLIFSAVDPSVGNELFVLNSSDGTAHLLQDLNPGQSSSNPSGFFAMPELERVFFTATTDNEGNELWALPFTDEGFPTAASLWKFYE